MRRSLESRQLVTSEPARKTMCSVSGIANEKAQLLMTEIETKRATIRKWRWKGILIPLLQSNWSNCLHEINKNWPQVIKCPLETNSSKGVQVC